MKKLIFILLFLFTISGCANEKHTYSFLLPMTEINRDGERYKVYRASSTLMMSDALSFKD